MATNDLSQELCDLIDAVVRRTRLWRSEKRDVRAELESHFREGMRQLARDGIGRGKAVRILRERFGDPRLAARLIRRSKKRGRHVFWKLSSRIAYATVLFLCLTVAYGAWLSSRKPNPSIDYVAGIHEQGEAIPEEDRAWPMWKNIILNFKPMPASLQEVYGTLLRLGKDDPHWPAITKWLEANQDLLPEIYQAARKTSFGFPYDYEQSRSFWVERAVSRGEPAVAPGPESAHFTGTLSSLWLPGLGDLRTIAMLLFLHASTVAEQGHFDAMCRSLDAAHTLGLQLIGAPFPIEQLVGAWMIDTSARAVTRILYERYKQLGIEDLRTILDCRLLTVSPERIRLDCTLDRLMIEDIVQHTFSDNGHGDGSLIPKQLQQVRKLAGVRDPANATDTPTWDLDVELILSAMIHAGRKETLARHDQFWRKVSRALQAPLYDPAWQEVEADLDTMRLDLVDRKRYAVLALMASIPSRSDLQMRQTSMRHEATQAIVALVRYRAAHGRFPGSLDALVPGDLPRRPVDAYSDAGLRYVVGENGEKLLYSVGRNLVDDGGSAAPMGESAGAAWYASSASPCDIIYWPPTDP